MTERMRASSYGAANQSKMPQNSGTDLGPKKTLLVLVIVVGCFAVLWPKVFYPMLVGSAQQHIKPSPIDRTTGCCNVISESDVNTIKIMLELCKTIIKKENDSSSPPLTSREIVTQCRKAVLETCGIDISAVLQERVMLGQNTKQIIDEIRSLNGSLCLKYNFGVSPWTLGVSHRISAKDVSAGIRQERPPHLRSEMVHPAFRERGRAIPQTAQGSSPSRPPPRIVEGRPGPIPGMRPTMGGAGHVVSPKQSNGTMGLIMPVYTIGIVIFFTYTVMKIVFKKQPESLYPPVEPDPVFRREVFESNRGHLGSKPARESFSNKLVVNAMSALLDEVDQELATRRRGAGTGTEQDILANGKLHHNHHDDQASVKVLGMEMTASCEGGKKWTRPDSPVTPPSPAVAPPQPPEPPQEIYLEGALPPQSNHLLVADSATETQKTSSTEEDPAVVLAGKMTLSVISLDSSENGTTEENGDDVEESNKNQEQDNGSSNVSEEFEKIDIENVEHEKVVGLEDRQETELETETVLDDVGKNVVTENLEKAVDEVGVIEEGSNEESEIDKLIDKIVEESNKEDIQLEEEGPMGVQGGSSDDVTNRGQWVSKEEVRLEAEVGGSHVDVVELEKVDSKEEQSPDTEAGGSQDDVMDKPVLIQEQSSGIEPGRPPGDVMVKPVLKEEQPSDTDAKESQDDVMGQAKLISTEDNERRSSDDKSSEELKKSGGEDALDDSYKTEGSDIVSETDKYLEEILADDVATIQGQIKPLLSDESETKPDDTDLEKLVKKEEHKPSESQIESKTEDVIKVSDDEEQDEEIEYEYEESGEEEDEELDDEIRNLNGSTENVVDNRVNGVQNNGENSDEEDIEEIVHEIVEYVTDEDEDVEEEEEEEELEEDDDGAVVHHVNNQSNG